MSAYPGERPNTGDQFLGNVPEVVVLIPSICNIDLRVLVHPTIQLIAPAVLMVKLEVKAQSKNHDHGSKATTKASAFREEGPTTCQIS